jgi:hypothetical protein
MGTSVEQLRTKAEGFIQDIAIINWEVVAEKEKAIKPDISARA